jgi:uncharacterized UBP type Zn finger protein
MQTQIFDFFHRRRTKEEMYRNLSIDVVDTTVNEANSKPSDVSVESGLSHFFQEEIREIKCERCSEGTHASQTQRILSR